MNFLISLFFLSFASLSCENPDKSAPIERKTTTFIEDMIGTPSQNCLYFGMWTYHFDPRWRGRNDNWFNNGLGAQYKGIFVVTLVNSHYKRCLAFGFTRDWISYTPFKHAKITFGFRLGGIYGYGKELNKYAAMFPIMPIYQLCSQVQYKRARLEFSYYRSLLSIYLTLILGEY